MFKASKSITGVSVSAIDYNNFKAFIDLSNNNITNFASSKIKGISIISLGDAVINKNILNNLLGDSSTFITGLSLSFDLGNFNITIPENPSIKEIQKILKELEAKLNNTSFTIKGNLSMKGNNLEGTGVETGFAVIMPSILNYNRVTNFKYNINKDSTKRFLLESYGYDPNMTFEELAYILLKSQKTFENSTEEELRNMSISLGAFLNKIFDNLDNLTAGNVDARFNWWGTNSIPLDSKFKNNKGSVIYDPWLIMNVNSNPATINNGQISTIITNVHADSAGLDHSLNFSLFFNGPKITLSTDKGSFYGKKSISLNWLNGKATAYLDGYEVGLTTVFSFDYDTAYTTVLILGKKSHLKISNANSEITMQPSGNSLILSFLIAVILTSSFVIYKRR